jgi:hypothetical protein
LEGFEEGLDSWARYPCALAMDDTMDEPSMQADLWFGYGTLMKAYGKRLRRLLSKGWHGPHGYYGRWTFRGNFLS